MNYVKVGSIAVSMMFVVELTLVPLLLSSIQNHLDLSFGKLAWIFNSYGFCVALGVIGAGWFGDTMRTTRVFAVGVLLFSMGSLMAAFAESFNWMLIGRIVQGLGAGVFSPLIPILLTRSSPDQPGRVLIVWGSITGIVAALAPLIYSNMLSDQAYQYAFVFLAVVSLCGLAILMAGSQNDTRQQNSMKLPSFKWMRNAKQLWAVFGYVFCTYGAFTYFLFRFPLTLTENALQFTGIGLLLCIMWLWYSVLSSLLRKHVDGPYLTRIVLIAPILMASGFVILGLTDSLPWLFTSALFVVAGLAFSNSPSTQLILRFAPEQHQSLSSSLDITFARIGGVLTVATLASAPTPIAAIAMVGLSGIGFACAYAALVGLIPSENPS